jgi:hypothetical protein
MVALPVKRAAIHKPVKGILAIVFAVVAVSGCSVGHLLPAHSADLEKLERSNKPYFFVGRTFDGLELTHTETYETADDNTATLVYGDCEPVGDDGGCAPPLELQHRLCGDELAVVIYVGVDRKPGRAARAANALRPVNDAARRIEPDVAFDRAPPCRPDREPAARAR